MNKVITVCSVEQYDAGFPETGLLQTIKWFKDKLNDIPEEYRKNALCDISTSRGYEDSVYSTITITYERPETDEETDARRLKTLEARLEQIKWAEDHLAKLKVEK